MGLFEIFKQKQVRIIPEKQVTVEYIRAKQLSEFFPSTDKEVLFIKHALSQDDLILLKSLRGSCIVFATHPDSMAAFDVQHELMKIMPVNILNSTGLNYLHYDDVLYIFADINDIDAVPDIPNIIRIHPVHRNDVENQISMETGVPDAALANEELPGTRNIPQNCQQNSDEDGTSANVSPKQQTPGEVDLVRTELKKLFDARYTIVKIELKGTSIERKAISLSEFYTKHNIEKGRLKGSWSLFDKEHLSQIMDVGIVRKAIDALNGQFTVNIDCYGRIIRTEKTDAFIVNMKGIERDYISYLNNENKRKKIGVIEIKTRFAGLDELTATRSDLLGYLLSFCSIQGLSTEKYISDVNRFVDEAYWKTTDFASNVDLCVTQLTYTESQWKNHKFVYKVWQTCNDRSNRHFFDQDFTKILERYIELLRKN